MTVLSKATVAQLISTAKGWMGKKYQIYKQANTITKKKTKQNKKQKKTKKKPNNKKQRKEKNFAMNIKLK